MQAQTLRTFPAPQVSQRRFVGIGFVVLLHVALVYALLNGLGATIINAVVPDAITVTTVIEKPPPVVTPTPQQPPTTSDERVFVPEPDMPYSSSQGTGDTALTHTTPQQIPVTNVRPAVSIMSTHTRPPYPQLAIRNGEVGAVTLRMTVSESGNVTDASVLRSSGYPRLDTAAIAWVKAHWRYQPATRDGRAVATTADARVDFQLN